MKERDYEIKCKRYDGFEQHHITAIFLNKTVMMHKAQGHDKSFNKS